MRRSKRIICLALSIVMCLGLFSSFVTMAAFDAEKIENAVGFADITDGDDPVDGCYESGKTFALNVSITDDEDNPITLTEEDTCTLYKVELTDEELDEPQTEELCSFTADTTYNWTPEDGFYIVIAVVEKGADCYVGILYLNVGKKDLSEAGWALYIQQVLYTGKPVSVPMQVYFLLDDDALEFAKDYKVTYKNNLKMGVGTVMIEGIGDYCGTLKLDFEIVSPSKDFKDVDLNAWYRKAIDFATYYGLFNGTGETTFEPQSDMTRGMFVTVLSRLAGVTVNNNVYTKFKDVPKGKWYTGAVKWAADNNIVSGVSANSFAPNESVTREQICKMMVEYCKVSGITLKNVNKEVKFKDASKISGWAKKYVKQCQMAGIVNGDNGSFNPKGKATRAEVATVLYNFCENYMTYIYDFESQEGQFVAK